ncbi:NAD(P)H-dependent oxidoreductase [Paenibacillus sp. GSMTC-2017]|uniref:NAD(P)H-dependent oxidoreductase n=1 Tax=Paenibacillus sp. GSMTC-2017 TaxID=2794350 RepID=UPI0018D74366|nr:NAD(P)H-dependent oxidoreductase [Paenibacillus sp. GSMTC-2017]MBH5319618.1 NAD(P)H-dependent oxidoreductase [Paenibacillus sp. GSMTC-2017]
MNILVISAHPSLDTSRVNSAFALELQNKATITFRDLYHEYPDWNIDVTREQQLLLAYDRIVFQFPFYWYSTPPLLKKWFDDVLTYGWAFGPGGDHLKDKEFIVATTVGGTEGSYRSGGNNLFTLSELLRPIQTTIFKCNGTFLPAFATYNVTNSDVSYFAEEAKKYAAHIQTSANDFNH